PRTADSRGEGGAPARGRLAGERSAPDPARHQCPLSRRRSLRASGHLPVVCWRGELVTIATRWYCPKCGALSSEPGVCSVGALYEPTDDPLMGWAIGSFRINRLISATGMGRVYMAVQPSIGARVAVKVLSAELARNPDLIERFFAEARAVNIIRHEQIINIID